MSGTKIEEQKEVQITVDDFERARDVLRALGCKDKNYQETTRELWKLDSVEVTIDTWPYLEPFIEIEGSSEAQVREVSEKLGFNWSEARFCSADKLYAEKYGIESRVVNRQTPVLTFDIPNPFSAGK
jgi:adenylate cyclase class 2